MNNIYELLGCMLIPLPVMFVIYLSHRERMKELEKEGKQ